ncbi:MULTISPECIES: GNAT family N-acetyltransferase [unclassified Devosia]|uniref:GNAT family N-acetyltransferase n=1 Tax=unclassified Devosia TaxID=196773 RepID=UPI001551C247|nr:MULTISPECIES: GNAT family N-acetyltransferase [unclassified Devosia]
MSPPAVTIRQARLEDRPLLNQVMLNASLAVETGEVLRRLTEAPGHFRIDEDLLRHGQIVVAEANGAPVGFAAFSIGGSEFAELAGMFVDPPYWRRGIGRQILEAVERELLVRQATGIRVVAGTTAVPFYQAQGFTVVGKEKTPLGPVVPVMTKSIG